MQKIFIDDISPGDIIAKDIYSSDGRILLSKGSVVEGSHIKRFDDVGINEIFIEESSNKITEEEWDYYKDLHIDDVIYEKTRAQAKMQVKKMILRYNKLCLGDIARIRRVVDDIMEQLLQKKDIVLTLSKLRSIDDYTYEHSVNVCVLSLIVGSDLHLNIEELKQLGIGAMLHDIGKIRISERIIKKPSGLSGGEFQEIKSHTQYGYEILIQAGVSEQAALIALLHHERYDGTGYPSGIGGNDIPLFSRIVSIADVYDAISNDRVYRIKMQPEIVYKKIACLANKHFDEEITTCFIRHITMYPNGTGVVLNTKHRGVVIGQNKLLPHTPIIRIFRKDRSNLKDLYTDIDLSITRYLFIIDTF